MLKINALFTFFITKSTTLAGGKEKLSETKKRKEKLTKRTNQTKISINNNNEKKSNKIKKTRMQKENDADLVPGTTSALEIARKNIDKYNVATFPWNSFNERQKKNPKENTFFSELKETRTTLK